jgi:hypothetical protein
MASRICGRLRRCVLLSLCWFWFLNLTYLPMAQPSRSILIRQAASATPLAV